MGAFRQAAKTVAAVLVTAGAPLPENFEDPGLVFAEHEGAVASLAVSPRWPLVYLIRPNPTRDTLWSFRLVVDKD
jgi:hypothetical protein